MSRLNPDELAALLYGRESEREGLADLEIVVTLRKPEEVEELIAQNKALRSRIMELEEELNRKRMDKVEAVHYGQLLVRARKELKKHGLSTDWIK